MEASERKRKIMDATMRIVAEKGTGIFCGIAGSETCSCK